MLALLLALAASAQGSPPAEAAPPARPAPRVDPVTRRQLENRRWSPILLQRFARCFVEDNPRAAAEIVDPPLSTGEEARQTRLRRAQLPIDRCLSIALGRNHMFNMLISADLGVAMPVLLGAFAEHLYRRRFDEPPPLAAADVPPLADAEDAPAHFTYLFANCLIDRDAVAVDALLRTHVGSDEEGAAFAALAAHFAGCLDQGSTIELNRITLRTALADQLYRRALAYIR